jgi:hypothetical protein
MASHIEELDRRRGVEDSEIGTSHSFSAPTPYNTYFSINEPGDDDHHLSTPAKSSGSVSFEAYPEGGGDGDVSFGPSISSPSRDHDHDHGRSVYTASHASAHLISPTRSFDPTISVLPPSNLSIPAPPSRLSSTGTKLSLIPLSDLGTEGSSSSSDASKWTWKGRKKAKVEMTQDDRDAQRLKQLGYDAVLGREYNFWSSLAITTLNIGALQVSTAGAISTSSGLMNRALC